MMDAFHMGGWGMYPTLFFGLLMVAASVRYAISPERRFVPLQVSLGILTLMAGALGFVTGVIKSFAAVGEVQPDARWIWMLGVSESLHNLALALILLVLGSILGTLGAYRFAQMARPEPERTAA